jgi:hypothetical protein
MTLVTTRRELFERQSRGVIVQCIASLVLRHYAEQLAWKCTFQGHFLPFFLISIETGNAGPFSLYIILSSSCRLSQEHIAPAGSSYYFFATFVNEVADNLFVVPTTTSHGWKCKAFSIALEMFQLGALCPAAIFDHWDCLHYTDPLGVSLVHLMDLLWRFISVVLSWFVCSNWQLVVLAMGRVSSAG